MKRSEELEKLIEYTKSTMNQDVYNSLKAESAPLFTLLKYEDEDTYEDYISRRKNIIFINQSELDKILSGELDDYDVEDD
ncbi:MAG: hypothetical protein WCR36_03450 [Bacteroidaceae bacterium]